MIFSITRLAMQSATKLVAGLLFVVATWLLLPAWAHSCPPPDCERNGYFGVDDGADIPPNTYGIPWAPDSSYDSIPLPEDEHVRLIRDPDGEAIEVEVTVEQTEEFPWLVVPDDPFEGGESYELSAACPRYDAEDAEFQRVRWTTAEDNAEAPQQLGTLRIDAEEHTAGTVAASPTCSVDASLYVVDLEVELAADATPWAGILQFETHVTDDGGDTEVWSPSTVLGREHAPGASWVGRTAERLYIHCGNEDGVVDGLEPGSYEVSLAAELPGEDALLATDVVEVNLDCSATDNDNGDGDTANGSDTGVGEDADGDSTSEVATEGGGCACATAPTSGSMVVVLFLVMLAGIRRPMATVHWL